VHKEILVSPQLASHSTYLDPNQSCFLFINVKAGWVVTAVIDHFVKAKLPIDLQWTEVSCALVGYKV